MEGVEGVEDVEMWRCEQSRSDAGRIPSQGMFVLVSSLSSSSR